MFDLVYKHKRVVQVIMALLVVPFAIWGIESYTRVSTGRDAVATVNGSDITRRELDERMAQQLEQVRRAFGTQFDPAQLDTPEARRAILDGMISQRLVMSEAARRHLFMTKAAVIDAIADAPEFQENGKFSEARFTSYLASRSMTAERYVADLQTELPLARLVSSVAEGAIAPRSVTTRLLALEAQKREVSEVRIFGQQFLSQTGVDEAQIKAYYDGNPGEFRSPERVRAEYVMLTADGLAKQDPVTEAEVKAAYEQRASQFSVAETRNLSHILIKTKDEADKILAEARKTPARFAELAKKHSLDTGSAEKGGDLGVVGKDALDPKLAEAVFAMKQGEMRVAESQFGFHVLRVTAVQGGKARSLEEVRKELTAELAKQKGARKFAEAGEVFSNMVYEQPDSLKPAAEKFKLQVNTTGWIAKSARQELGALDNPKLLAALFSADALKDKRNTDAVQVAPGVLVAARVIEHRSEEQVKYDEVKAAIGEMLRRRAAAALAQKDGEAKLAELKKGKDGLKWSPARTVSRREAQGMPAEALQSVVSADVSALPAYVGIRFPEGYLLVRISKVIEAEAKDADPQSTARIGGLYGRSQYEAYVGSLRARGNVEINQPNLEKK